MIIGNIGSRQRLEFAVLGDSVSTTNHLEAATRTQGVRCLLCKAVVDVADAAGDPHPDDVGPIAVRGRTAMLEVYSLDVRRDRASDGQGRVVPAANTG